MDTIEREHSGRGLVDGPREAVGLDSLIGDADLSRLTRCQRPGRDGVDLLVLYPQQGGGFAIERDFDARRLGRIRVLCGGLSRNPLRGSESVAE